MRLMRVGEPGHESPVLAAPNGHYYDLSPSPPISTARS